MNYYERYCGDYARDTALLSLAEHGAYTLLLDAYYSTESALPASLVALCKLCRASGKLEERAVTAVAERFFPVGVDGLRHNQRADRDIPKARKRIESARRNGAKRTKPEPSGIPSGIPSGPPQRDTQPLTQPGEASPAPAPTPTKARSKPSGAPAALPPWLPAEAWHRWGRHRGSKLTKQAITLQINKLDALRQAGHDPVALIELAIESGWATFYPPRTVGNAERGNGRATVNEGIWGERRSDDDAIDGTAERIS